jgi:hypothetical protein
MIEEMNIPDTAVIKGVEINACGYSVYGTFVEVDFKTIKYDNGGICQCSDNVDVMEFNGEYTITIGTC